MAAHGGLAYLETPSGRARRTQRRLAAVAAILSMASATALLGAMADSDRAVAGAPPAAGPLNFIRF